MNTIGKFRFVLGIVIVSSIVGFLVSVPFASILNTNDVVSSGVVKGIISIAINVVSVFVAFYYALKIKKYILPATKIEISLWVGLGFLVVSLISLLLFALSVGSSNILGFISVTTILMMIKNFLITFVISFLSINLLHGQVS